MDGSTIVWVGSAVVALVFFDVLFVEVRRALRETKRILRRVSSYGELPIFSLIASTERDVTRLTTTLEAIPELLLRAEAAIAAIRAPFTRFLR